MAAAMPNVEGWIQHDVVHLQPEEWVTDVEQIDDEDSTDNEDSTDDLSG